MAATPEMRNSPLSLLALGGAVFGLLTALSYVNQTASLIVGAIALVAVLVRLIVISR